MEQQHRNCGHYLQVYRLEANEKRAACLWAKCRMCKRRWNLGVDVDSVPVTARDSQPIATIVPAPANRTGPATRSTVPAAPVHAWITEEVLPRYENNLKLLTRALAERTDTPATDWRRTLQRLSTQRTVRHATVDQLCTALRESLTRFEPDVATGESS